MKYALMLTLLLLSTVTHAEGDGGPALPQVQYIYFEPAFVVNYGSSGRMKFLRTDVALRVSNTEAAAIASQHKPYMRHHLVMLFSAQEADVMTSPTGRETLRKQALEELRELLTELEGNPAIDDVYFNNFVVQN